jgi:hypothetical protein
MKKAKTKMVFSKEKWKQYKIANKTWTTYSETRYNDEDSWLNDCEGKTRAEAKKLNNYGLSDNWLVEVDA